MMMCIVTLMKLTSVRCLYLRGNDLSTWSQSATCRSDSITFDVVDTILCLASLVMLVWLPILAECCEVTWCAHRSKSNIFDVAVTALCLASLVMLVWLPTWAEYIEEDVAFLLRCTRDLFRLFRLFFLLKK